MKTVVLPLCAVEYTDYGCVTRFEDGAECAAWPHPNDHHYTVAAHRAGYGDDVMSYCREHDLLHSYLAHKLAGKVSAVIWCEAHNVKPTHAETVMEEITVQAFQRYLRANEEPIVGGVDWDGMKREALGLLSADLN